MLRAWFLFIVVVGILSSGLSSCGSRINGAPAGIEPARAPDDPIVVTGSAASLAEAHPGGDALTLQREWDGHFYANAEINGATVRMLVDTGASGIALTREDARKAGIGISIGMPNVVGQGAGGAVKGEYVTLDRISLGSETAQDVPAVVLDGGGQSLLGQSFLSQFASVEIRGDRMFLR